MNYGPNIVAQHPHLGDGTIEVDPTYLFAGLGVFALAMMLVGRPAPKPKPRRRKLKVRSPFQSPFYRD